VTGCGCAEHSLGGKERYPRPRRELVSYGMGKSARVAKPLGLIHPVVHIGESEWDFQMKPERPVRGSADRADLCFVPEACGSPT
jgi:hypothetical protein